MTDHQKTVFRVFGSLFVGLIVPALIAVLLAGFTRQGLEIWHLIMRWLIRASWCFIIGFFFYSLYLAEKEKEQIEMSRDECKKAHRALFAYLQESSLKGFEDPECQRLHARLGKRLAEHKSNYFADFLFNSAMRHYRRYWNDVRHLEAHDY